MEPSDFQNFQAFQMAILRCRDRLIKEGRTVTHGELLHMAQEEMERHERERPKREQELMALAAERRKAKTQGR
jgi:hypothetical protein